METISPHHDQADPPTLGEYRRHPIYPMPVFATVAAADPAATVAWFTEVLDFEVMFSGPEMGGVASLTHLRRAKYQDVLVVPGGNHPRGGGSLTFTIQAGDADTVDDLAARVAHRGDRGMEGPVDTPWNTREFSIRDPDGNSYVITGRGRGPMPGFGEAMEAM